LFERERERERREERGERREERERETWVVGGLFRQITHVHVTTIRLGKLDLLFLIPACIPFCPTTSSFIIAVINHMHLLRRLSIVL